MRKKVSYLLIWTAFIISDCCFVWNCSLLTVTWPKRFCRKHAYSSRNSRRNVVCPRGMGFWSCQSVSDNFAFMTVMWVLHHNLVNNLTCGHVFVWALVNITKGRCNRIWKRHGVLGRGWGVELVGDVVLVKYFENIFYWSSCEIKSELFRGKTIAKHKKDWKKSFFLKTFQWCIFPLASSLWIKILKDQLFQPSSGLWSD